MQAIKPLDISLILTVSCYLGGVRNMEAGMRRHLLPLALCIGLAGCAAAEPDYSGSYVGGDDTALIQLQIVESDGGDIKGSVSVSAPDYEAGDIASTTKAISGVRRGEQFSLVAHAKDWGAPDAPLALEARGKSLILNVPATGQTIELASMNQSQYRLRLAKLADALNANDVGQLPED